MKKTTINAQEEKILSPITVTPETRDAVEFLLEINPNITPEEIYQTAVDRTKSDIQEALNRQASILDVLACTDPERYEGKIESILAAIRDNLERLTSNKIEL